MDIKKVLGLTLIALFSVTGVFAKNARGIDLYRAGLYEAAKLELQKQQVGQSGQELAENYYYLGKSYHRLQDVNKAAEFYAKAIATAPEYPLGYLGEGEVLLAKGDAKGADASFKKASALVGKKDASVQATIAEIYVDNNRFAEASAALDKARKINKSYSGIYTTEGDMFMKQGQKEQAYSSYDQALYFDAKDKEAYLKLARGYKNSNANVAKEYLEKLVAIDPDYIPAYAEIGDLYGISSIDESKVNYTKALAAYEKFISIPGVPTLQQERYAQILYFTDNYEKSLQHINSVLKTDPENAVMHRLQGYNNYKLGNVELSVQQLAKFLQEQPADKHIYLDYITYGHALADAKQPEAAVEAFLKAAALNPAKPEIYKELAVTYTNAKNYPEAIKAYEKYFELEPEPSATDKYFFGQTIYYAASKYIAADYAPSEDQKQTDDATFNAYIEKGNVAFADVIKRSPDSYLGYFWRARLNTFVDLKTQETKTSAMQGVAKPYFEEAVEVMLKNNEDGKRNKDIIEAYRYLASYYLLLDDNAAGGEYFKKILLIDPANVQAKETLDALHIKY